MKWIATNTILLIILLKSQILPAVNKSYNNEDSTYNKLHSEVERNAGIAFFFSHLSQRSLSIDARCVVSSHDRNILLFMNVV